MESNQESVENSAKHSRFFPEINKGIVTSNLTLRILEYQNKSKNADSAEKKLIIEKKIRKMEVKHRLLNKADPKPEAIEKKKISSWRNPYEDEVGKFLVEFVSSA